MRKALVACAITAVISSGAATLSMERADDNAATFWLHDQGRASIANPYGDLSRVSLARQQVAQTIQREVNSRYGPQWVEPAMRIAKVESNYQCHVRGPMTRHGRAVGPMQVLESTAISVGISASDLKASCKAQIEASMRYLGKCIRAGADTPDKMASCWVSGSPHNRRLAKKYASYRERYIKMAQTAKIPTWVGTLDPWRS